LLALVSVYTHPFVNVTVPPPGVAFALEMAEARLDVAQDTVAALADCAPPRLPIAPRASTAVAAMSRRTIDARRMRPALKSRPWARVNAGMGSL